MQQSLTVAAQTTPITQDISLGAAGDTYRLSDLFTGAAPAGQTITEYQVDLADGGGKLQVGGQDVSPGQTDFTAADFAQLTYIAGPGEEGQQLPQNLTVTAQTASLPTDGTISQDIGFDADITDAPYPMDSLFTESAPAGQAIVGYQVTLGEGGGTLMDGTDDVTGQTSFTADQFAHLTYIVGTDGAQSLTVEAQTTPLPTDPITQKIDFNAAGDTYQMGDLFTASAPAGGAIAGYQVTLGAGGGKLQLNGQDFLNQSTITPDDFAQLTYIAGPGASGSLLPQSLTVTAQPEISQNVAFTHVADVYRMDDLFHASAPTGQTIVGYRVALGAGGGALHLGTTDVTSQTTPFTADEFRQLTYVAGTEGSQSLTVVAQTGTLQKDGTLTQEIDSQAMQITANVTGVRSINAMDALSTQLENTNPDASTVSIAQQAGIFTGWSGTSRPTLQTDGNFTAVGGDNYRMSDLFKRSASAGQTIVGYRVALDDGGDSGGGQLLLNGKPTDLTEFSADDFRHLTYFAGTGGSQSLTVVAQTGTLLSDGTTLTHEIDSAAVQITANVTGTRSINAMNALSNVSETDPDANTVSIAQQAGIFTGWSGATRPTLQTALDPDPPLPISDLQNANGTYRSAGVDTSSSDTDLSSFYAASIGNEVSPGLFTSPGGALATALLLLGGEATGAFQTAGETMSEQAIKAYNTTAKL